MNKKFTIICCAVIALTSCNKMEMNIDSPLDIETINQKAASVFGKIDSNQDWNSINSGVVNITADADLENIVKVQILTESPFMNSGAKVLTEKTVQKGETVTLAYDAANIYNELVAACVNSEGVYYIQSFKVGDKDVNFQGTTRSASRRALAETYNFPDISNFVMPEENSFRSYNAMRSFKSSLGLGNYNEGSSILLWKDKGWDKERMWRLSGSADSKTEYGNGWEVQNFSIRQALTEGLSEREENNLKTIFKRDLDWTKQNMQQDNLLKIRNSKYVELFNSQFTTNGEPVVLTPLQATSSDISSCDLYYYYYDPQVIEGMSESEQVQYFKDLPKFMAIDCKDAMHNQTRSDLFYKEYQYVLPYYGEPEDLVTTVMEGYTSEGVYRISNIYTDKGTYYLTYTDEVNALDQPLLLKEKIEGDGKDMQLWQIFRNGNNCYLYNIGKKAFLHNDVNGWQAVWSTSDMITREVFPYEMVEAGEAYQFKATSFNGQVHGKMLGTDLTKSGNNFNTGVWADKNDNTCKWILEPYTSDDVEVKAEIRKVVGVEAKSFIIPKGYKVGMLLNNSQEKSDDQYNLYLDKSFANSKNGQLYADGRLNTEINQFPSHFSKPVTKYSMQVDETRASIFSANNKTYLTFEDGEDCNYVDMIFEVSSGIEQIYDKINPHNDVFTLCFEDRPEEADYDMNDVVLKCTRKDATTLVLSLVACGANDNIVIHGATGWKYNDQEVHGIFGLSEPDSNGNRFINTVEGGTTHEAVSAEVTIDANTTTVEYLQGIYIKNEMTGKTIPVAKKGDAPFGIIVAQGFYYPKEKVSIITAYPKFASWAQNANVDTNWYLYETEGKVYKNSSAE